ncbi:MAG: EamA family transporter [Oscillospiraceae bacterium]|nr:EamA family transporter [Oscillospiraceae bacterium]
MLDRFLNKKRNIYIMALAAIFCESFSSVFLKLAGGEPFLSLRYLFFYGAAVAVMGIYAVAWQLILEKLPLTTAYLRKGVTYVLIFVWAALIFGERITIQQVIGIAIIIAGMVVSMRDDH